MTGKRIVLWHLFDRAKFRELPILLYILLMVVFFSFTTSGFWAVRNFENLSRQIAVVGIISTGMTLVILTGGIDLSVGSILAFSISIGGAGIPQGRPIWLIYPLILFLGTILGFTNGILITRISVPALIITLGTMNIFRGITMVITRGIYITPIPAAYTIVGRGYLPFLFLLVVILVFMFITLRTRFGRNIYAIGGGEQAALYSGVPVIKYKVIVYTLSGFLSAFAGLILIGRSGFIQPQAGVGYEMNAIAAVVIGGTSIFGGTGSILGTFFGATLMGLILTGLTMRAVDPYWQGLVTGILVVLAISLDSLRQMRSHGQPFAER
ncbi:MAG: ABC transporter permease [Atribacterota bacterium]